MHTRPAPPAQTLFFPSLAAASDACATIRDDEAGAALHAQWSYQVRVLPGPWGLPVYAIEAFDPSGATTGFL